MMLSENWSAWQVLNQLFAFDPNNTSASAVFSGQASDAAFRTLIYYFNVGILMAVIAIYAFILVIGTINTAKDGTFLGKNWSSYWIPLRVILGSTFAIPLKSGFCMAQYLIFLMVSVSIQFANGVWQKTYSQLDQNKVPPIASFEISDGIKSDIALYLLAEMSMNMLNNSAPPTQTGEYQVEMSRKPDHMSFVQGASQIEKNIDTNKIEGASFLWDESKSLKIGNLNKLKQGMQQFSEISTKEVTKDDKTQSIMYYSQYYVDSLIDQYRFKLNQDKVDNSKVKGLFGGYCSAIIDTSACDTFKQSKGDEKDSNGKYEKCIQEQWALKTQCQNYADTSLNLNKVINCTDDKGLFKCRTIEGLASLTMQGFQNKIKSESGSDKGKDKVDWWNADQEYFRLDDGFTKVLTQFHNDFALFDQLFYQGQQDKVKLHRTQITLKYLEDNFAIDDLIKDIDDNLISYTVSPDSNNNGDKYKALKVPLNPVSADDKSDKFANVDMSEIKQKMVSILQKNYIYKGKKGDDACSLLQGVLFSDNSGNMTATANCQSLVNNLIPASISLDIGKYFFVINAALQTDQTNIGKTQLDDIVDLLKLIRVFQLNHVSFFHEGALVSDLATPAESFLDEVFEKMSLNSNSAGVFNQIYNIGETVNGDVASTNPFSALRQIQGVGQSLIAMVINTLQSIVTRVKQKTDDMIENVIITQSTSKGAALVAAAASYWVPGLPGVLSSIGDMTSQILMVQNMFSLSMDLIWLPLVFFVLVTLFTNAVLFALIIPMAPFILFWAGKIAWLLLIIEALVAAPVVALGLVYPEGHEVYGKAEPAIQIMLNLVLRPVLMICGLIIGVILTYLVITISAKGFHAVATQIASVYGTSSNSYVTGSLNILLVFMYAGFIGLAFYKCFSLIYILPDKILHWVGGTHNERAGEQDMQEMKSSSIQSAQGMAQSGTQTVEKANQSHTEHAQGVQNIGQSAGGVTHAADTFVGSVGSYRRNSGKKESEEKKNEGNG
ncbi:DotA/TraY family protein [Cysteiniphilum litorale]|uniref:DotA/TraY family protein n=1 Tax=Cysteiniphilum litorale TaxID=2056700 RepID=UPI003F883DB9